MDSDVRAPRVLIADDAPEVARRVRDLVEDACRIREITLAADGSQALDLFRAVRPAIVILDLNMPCMSGLDVLRHIRALDQQCLVVVFTSHDEPSLRDSCLKLGANNFLHKARGLDELVTIVSAFITDSHA